MRRRPLPLTDIRTLRPLSQTRTLARLVAVRARTRRNPAPRRELARSSPLSRRATMKWTASKSRLPPRVVRTCRTCHPRFSRTRAVRARRPRKRRVTLLPSSVARKRAPRATRTFRVTAPRVFTESSRGAVMRASEGSRGTASAEAAEPATTTSASAATARARVDSPIRRHPSRDTRSARRQSLLLPCCSSTFPNASSTSAAIVCLKTASSDLGGDRPQALDRLGDLGPALVGLAGVVERLPELVEEQLHERCDADWALRLTARSRSARRRAVMPARDDLLGRAQQRRARGLEAPVAERDEEAELLALCGAPSASRRRSARRAPRWSRISGASVSNGAVIARRRPTKRSADRPARRAAAGSPSA